MLLKASYLSRQRKAVNYGHKYVITDHDLIKAKERQKVKPSDNNPPQDQQ